MTQGLPPSIAAQPPLATPPLNALGYEAVWRLALTQELGLVVEVPEGTDVLSTQSQLYIARKAMLEIEPTLPLRDFYLTMPAGLPLILIVREQKDEPLE